MNNNEEETYKTTKKDFELFKKEFLFWQERFGLINWGLNFVHGESELLSEAWIATKYKDRLASIGLGIVWHRKPISNDIKKVAFHEACELLLTDLCTIAITDAKPSEEIEVDRSTHDIIKVLEVVIFDEYYKKGK